MVEQPIFKLKKEQFHYHTYQGPPPFCFVEIKQQHTTHILEIQKDLEKSEIMNTVADGFYTPWDQFTSPLAVKTADCLPVILSCQSGLFFIHAGHKGIRDGILRHPLIQEQAIDTLIIGPHIRPCCFEVQQDFLNKLSPHLLKKILREEDKRLTINLALWAEIELKSIGVVPKEKRVATECTCCHPLFYSYRENRTAERNYNILSPSYQAL